MVIGVRPVHRVVRMIQPGSPGVDRAERCAGIGRVAGGPHAVNYEGVVGPIDGNADGVIVGDGIFPKVGGEIVGCGGAARAINPVVKPVGLLIGARRCVVPGPKGNGVRIGAKISTDIARDIAAATSPGTGYRIEPVVNSLLRVVPAGTVAIVIEPIIDLNGPDVSNPTPVPLMLIPIVGRGIHPRMVRS